MTDKEVETDKQELEKDSITAGEKKYVLRLYVVGAEQKSSRAIVNLRSVCEEHLAGLYELEIIDIQQQPTLARDEQIVAVPTLIRQLPEPLRKLIGDMSNKEKVLFGMDLRPLPSGKKDR